jgi:ATP-dependent RNA helicase DeaD
MENFKDLDLNPSLKRAIAELGFETPTPIQAQTLPILLGEPTDFLGLAATGTGKTAAFGIPLLQRLLSLEPSKRTQAIVLCPTRELAIQVAGQLNLMARYLKIKALPVYGGTSYGEQVRGLRDGATIVVGTPGRVVDHLERGTLRLDDVAVVVLDEADEMISMGFKEALEAILGETPEEARTWLFSATMSNEVRRVADEYLREPGQVQVNRTEMLPENLQQIYYPTRESDKPEILCKLIDAAEDFYGIVFCQTKSLVMDLTQYLVNRGYQVDCLHGDKDQNARERTMKAFRERKVTLLICTDVASRGLDVKDITHVINYSLPRELDSYVHRIGRTARSGKTGFAMSLVTPSHRGLVRRIEQMTKSKMIEGKLPTRKDIGEKKVTNILEKFLEQKNYTRAIDLMDHTWKEKLAKMSAEEIAGRFLSLTFPEVFAEREEIDTTPAPVRANTSPNGVVIRTDDLGDRRDRRDNREGGRENRYRGARDRDDARSDSRSPRSPKNPWTPRAAPGGPAREAARPEARRFEKRKSF